MSNKLCILTRTYDQAVELANFYNLSKEEWFYPKSHHQIKDYPNLEFIRWNDWYSHWDALSVEKELKLANAKEILLVDFKTKEPPMLRDIEVPLYQCHKQVRALEIATVISDSLEDEDYIYLTFSDNNFGFLTWKLDYSVVERYMPKEGDYLMLYPDGYVSISPRHAFLDGYSLIKNG